MEKVIWVIESDRDRMIDMQRKINSFGSMRAICMLSVDALKKMIDERLNEENRLCQPSLILLDYQIVKEYEYVTGLLKNHPKLAGVPLFFIVDEDYANVDMCYEKGAMVVLQRPINESGIIRIERAAWQYETTRNYERILQKQVSELETAREIHKLNLQLENRNEFLHKVFGKYFSDEILDVILEKPEGAFVGGDRQELAVMMADLRGFSALSDEMNADEITDLLNCYFGTMVEIISKYNGTVIEFMGDGILAIFGAPVRSDLYCENAIAAALCMQNAMAEVNEYCINKGHELLEMGIGIHCGETFVGNVGSERMMRYNVIGKTVNECSRIEGCSVGGQILVSQKVLEKISCDVHVIDVAQIFAKGVSQPIVIYEVKGVGGGYNCFLENDNSYEMCSPEKEFLLELHPVNNKLIEENYLTVRLKEFSIRNANVEILDKNDDVRLFTDFEVRLDNHESGFSGVYAKVMKVEDDRLGLRFTHVNREFRQFAEILQGKILIGRGVIMDKCEECKISLVRTTLEDLGNIASNTEWPWNCTLYWAPDGEDIKLVFGSNDKSIRALEFVDYLVEDYAMINGNDKIARTTIPKAFLTVMMSELETDDVENFLQKKIDLYYTECKWIYGDEFLSEHEKDIVNMQQYVKKPIAWAFVKTTDVVDAGEKFRLKSLENESDIIVTASDEVYVMIGCRGEIYCIDSEKFDKTYNVTDEKLDVYKQMLDYLPEVRRFPDDEYISLDVRAHLCYPKALSGIYVTTLEGRTKVFTVHNKGEYFVGRKGDFLAIRTDDLTDMYIIQKEIFYQTYEAKE